MNTIPHEHIRETHVSTVELISVLRRDPIAGRFLETTTNYD